MSQPYRSKEQQATKDREKMASTITGLSEALMDLGQFSTTTTRRLDDTYYAVLEKLGMLQSTIISLKELADNSQDLNEVFKAESREVTADIGSQLDAFGQFDDQQKLIEDLQGRIQAGREKVQALSERVGIVQKRIEGWGLADKEWQERTRKRLKVIWLIMLTLGCIVTLLFVSAKYGPGILEASSATDLTSGKNAARPPLSGLPSDGSKGVEIRTGEVRGELNKRGGDGSVEGALLRAIDEL
ncbi:hypothetical protein SLS62_002782 [Diatrype stigma]|uniref:Uncharacterized protein n=1 Tax=Diatrype stigma TaxID=117547 RepID=A0AAN9UXS6_9PEZI